MVLIVPCGAVAEGDLGTHVVELAGEHAGDVDVDLAAADARGGNLPGVEAIGGVLPELHGDFAGRGEIDGVLVDLGIGGGIDDAEADDGSNGSSVVLRRRGGQGSGNRRVGAARERGRGGVIAGGIDGADGGIAALNAVDEPLDLAAGGGGGGELRFLTGSEGDVPGTDGDRAAAGGDGRRLGGRRGIRPGDGSLDDAATGGEESEGETQQKGRAELAQGSQTWLLRVSNGQERDIGVGAGKRLGPVRRGPKAPDLKRSGAGMMFRSECRRSRE